MANSTAELLATWNGFIKDIARLSKVAFTAPVSSIKNYIKNIQENKKKLEDTYNSTLKSIAAIEQKIKIGGTQKNIDSWNERLKELRKQLAISPLNPANNVPNPKDKKEDKDDSGGISKWLKGLVSKDKLISLGKEVLTRGMDQEKGIAALTPQLGKGEAQVTYANIKKDAISTPFDLESVFAANKALIDAGVASNIARTNVLALAEAVSFKGGGNEELTKAADLMAKIKDSGKAGKDELKEFGDTGIDIYQALADFTGKSIDETKNMTVTYDQLTAALQQARAEGGAFAGAMDAQNNTAKAKMENFMESLQGGLADIGVALLPVLKRLFDFGMKLIDNLLPKIMKFLQPVFDILDSLPLEAVLTDVMNMVGVILAALTPVLENLKPLFASIFEVLKPLIQVVGEFVGILMQVLGPYLASLAKFLSAVLGPVIKIVGAILIGLVYMAGELYKAIKPVYEFIAKYIGKIADAINRFSKWIGLDKLFSNAKDTEAPEDPIKLSIPKDTVLPSTATKDTSLVNAGNIANPAVTNNTTVEKTADKTATEITSGGPRVININGVKFTEKIELHVTNAKEGLYDLELKLQEMFLRILNSGAVLQ